LRRRKDGGHEPREDLMDNEGLPSKEWGRIKKEKWRLLWSVWKCLKQRPWWKLSEHWLTNMRTNI
jgi:hypothetical protein